MYHWQPHEVSIVPIPADPLSGFFRSLTESQTMTTKTENRDAADIQALCVRHSVKHLAQNLIDEGKTLEQSRAVILDVLATRDQAAGGHLNVRAFNESNDESTERQLLVNTLVQRLGGKPSGDVIRSTDCTGLALRALQLRGINVSFKDIPSPSKVYPTDRLRCIPATTSARICWASGLVPKRMSAITRSPVVRMFSTRPIESCVES